MWFLFLLLYLLIIYFHNRGDKFAFGHHYLRPHETFHEPWRKFFPNEVIRSPLCEILPLDMVINHCWVLDLNSYCRGRPIGAQEDHVYVCEYRVDKGARVFSKISKPKYPVCVKPYAFITFPERLRPQRTYTVSEFGSSVPQITLFIRTWLSFSFIAQNSALSSCSTILDFLQ